MQGAPSLVNNSDWQWRKTLDHEKPLMSSKFKQALLGRLLDLPTPMHHVSVIGYTRTLLRYHHRHRHVTKDNDVPTQQNTEKEVDIKMIMWVMPTRMRINFMIAVIQISWFLHQ